LDPLILLDFRSVSIASFERSPRAVGVAVRVNMQDDPRDIAPVGTVRIGIEQAQVRDEMLLVVGGNRWIGWGQIS
jgi:hypothetical protein